MKQLTSNAESDEFKFTHVTTLALRIPLLDADTDANLNNYNNTTFTHTHNICTSGSSLSFNDAETINFDPTQMAPRLKRRRKPAAFKKMTRSTPLVS